MILDRARVGHLRLSANVATVGSHMDDKTAMTRALIVCSARTERSAHKSRQLTQTNGPWRLRSDVELLLVI